MKDRDIGVFFGQPPVVKEEPQKQPMASRIPAASNPQKTASATDEQKTVAAAMGNPDAAQQVASSPASDPRLDLLKSAAPTAVPKPWYENGTMPTGESPSVLSHEGVALGNAGAYGFASRPPQVDPTSLPKFRTMQSNLQDQKDAQALYEAERLKQHQEELKAHQEQVARAKAEHDAIEKEHQEKTERYNKALLENKFLKAATPEQMYKQWKQREAEYNAKQIGNNPPSVAKVERAPLGGLGTSNYAQEFGAMPLEALNVPSMSKMQKENIPRQVGALEAGEKLLPGEQWATFKGPSGQTYPFVLPASSGEKALQERLAPEQHALNEQKHLEAKENELQEKIKNELLQKRAVSDATLEMHEDAKRQAQKRLDEARKRLQSMVPPSPLRQTPAEMRQNELNQKSMQKMESNIEAARKAFKPNLGGAGYDEYSNTYPIGGAGDLSYAHELMLELANPKADKQRKSLITEELDKLQSKNPRLLHSLDKHYVK